MVFGYITVLFELQTFCFRLNITKINAFSPLILPLIAEAFELKFFDV